MLGFLPTSWGHWVRHLTLLNLPAPQQHLGEWGGHQENFSVLEDEYRKKAGSLGLSGLLHANETDWGFPFCNHLFGVIFIEIPLFFEEWFFMLQFILWIHPCYFLLLLLGAGFPQVLPEPIVIHQSDVLWMYLHQELFGCPPFVMIWWDDFNS